MTVQLHPQHAVAVLRYALDDEKAFRCATDAGYTVEITALAENECNEHSVGAMAHVQRHGVHVRVGLYLWDENGEQSAVVVVSDDDEAAALVVVDGGRTTRFDTVFGDMEGTFPGWNDATPRSIATWLAEACAVIRWTAPVAVEDAW